MQALLDYSKKELVVFCKEQGIELKDKEGSSDILKKIIGLEIDKL